MATAHRSNTAMLPSWVSEQKVYVVSFQVDPEGEGFQFLVAASKSRANEEPTCTERCGPDFGGVGGLYLLVSES